MKKPQTTKKPINWVHYLVCVVIALVVAVLLMYTNGLFSGEPMSDKKLYRILADAFFIPALLLLCTGGAILVYQEGAFDGLVYFFKQFTDAYKQRKDKYAHVQTFAEFAEAREAAEKLRCRHMMIVGSACMAISVVFVILNMTVA